MIGGLSKSPNLSPPLIWIGGGVAGAVSRVGTWGVEGANTEAEADADVDNEEVSGTWG